ncbi:type III-B CRISPR module RAMP protein Cmr6 [Paenibacillus pinihumi]|uniref:type III-B CRISPR module RAMP protein Cmr6 n=1 Tax=Paenibacillus pinihumi TaxID=669462 RepID=UPI000410190A|nr:type III-B CRISPR module RAMP protein Cmr6 [Paenibacillus pinihumi]
MNAHLVLTKHGSLSENSELLSAIKEKGDSKKKFYSKLLQDYKHEWKQVPSWYKAKFKQHYEQLSEPNFRIFKISNLQSGSGLLIGNGETSVLETHLTLHRTYGVPYIPGTALKGIAAHYCDRYLGPEHPELRAGNEFYTILFGSQEQAGFIHFQDAFPTPETVGTSLVLDVLTPHHQEYNQIKLSSKSMQETYPAPRDDDSPSPVHFLTVRADFKVLLTCENKSQEGNDWLTIAEAILVQAIEQEGVGGKTNAGYGLFQIQDVN